MNIFGVVCKWNFENSSNMAKNEDIPCSRCLQPIRIHILKEINIYGNVQTLRRITDKYTKNRKFLP